MISRLRVEVRAASMEAAEREAEIFLGHARQAGYLEGIVPQSSRITDHHFGRATVLRRPMDEPDEPWAALGLPYEGRIVVSFDPELTRGGLKLYGYNVERFDQQLDAAEDSTRGLDCTDQAIVLERQYPITRVHSWERSSAYGTLEQDHETGDLATFNRARHELVGADSLNRGLLAEVWLQGIVEGGEDQPTRILGTVSDARITSEVSSKNAPALWEYVYDLRIGDDINREVEAVFEKALIYAQGRLAAPNLGPSVRITNATVNASATNG